MNEDETRQHETPSAAQAPAEQAPAEQPPAEQPPASPPAAAGQAGPAGPNRKRVLAGLGVAGLILALTAGAVLLLGGPSTPEVLKYIPGDAAFVGEVRLDLPGDQLQKLGNLLAHFPGFADQSTLPAKLDETFTQLLRTSSNGEVDYVTDVKPWLNGPAFFAVSGPPPGADRSFDGSFLVASTTNGGVDCARTFEGQATTQEAYNGFTLVLATDDAPAACAVDGRFALFGDAASVRRGLDAKAGGTGLDKSAGYLAARRQLAGEQLATLYANGAMLRTLTPSAAPSFPIPDFGPLAGGIPDWFIAGVRAEDDALVVDTITAPIAPPSGAPALLSVPPAHASVLVGLVPADTLVYLEAQGTGVALQNLLATLRTVPEVQQPLQMLEGLADPADLVGWVEDAAIAVSADGTDPSAATPQVTVLLQATDAAAATEKVTTLRTLLGLLALGGQGVTVADTQVGGVTATTVTITDIGSLVPPGSIPDVGELSGEVTFSIASRDRVVYVTVGKGAIEEVLGLQAGGRLADSAAFKQASTRGLATSQTTMFVAVGAAVDFVEPFLPADVAARWATELKPYVEPFQALGAWSTSDAAGMRFRTVLTVAGP